MNRWRVERGFWWVAMQVDEQGREIPGTAKRFPTHAEALAYADKQARTMEITLPRKPGITKIGRRKHAIVTTTKNGGTALYIMDDAGDDHVIFMKTKYLEPLALALLAHAERIEE